MSPDDLVANGVSEITFKGHPIPFGKKQLDTVNEVKVKFLETNLSSRFDQDDEVLKAFKVLNPVHMPDNLDEDNTYVTQHTKTHQMSPKVKFEIMTDLDSTDSKLSNDPRIMMIAQLLAEI